MCAPCTSEMRVTGFSDIYADTTKLKVLSGEITGQSRRDCVLALADMSIGEVRSLTLKCSCRGYIYAR